MSEDKSSLWWRMPPLRLVVCAGFILSLVLLFVQATSELGSVMLSLSIGYLIGVMSAEGDCDDRR